ncbi:NAD(P)-dependent dehydrogenase (short-subunit alcohol dehydrogenase family) [Bradyrhizobium elkanii]|uniref:NAD(P)-dependent dehydrogenase (Short-subunit alcohol dehydrogenase family) n=2 Tax=Bradyrhizobium elkanii TaxID=29448 RepID=A0ABV4EX15_BRAEL|nr:NAD(P)-dependent dehydrogenase (short-subunit alcohol dehydrogenase family) [Bradyrhizobium elkanii]MCP1982232.1 NAD(P)-dependent dehydrogenase (short-subunit alcohol dehydrogenase family) [Bradyrhizobium elkanii]MCS3882984.1 NAD(P)-dependent dehydrogenase (short-subunit alcohol dehydrogenase family) [Bradyrhizobium elkanii]MCS4217959.1 NAD(P)-dependent dehydrogenase (short-subunit alcohol dehydrogenase family) [Bradyrhizobium elkanii]MCW2195591.1 NAD(P)-dependent dehydrogenase (short-subuni
MNRMPETSQEAKQDTKPERYVRPLSAESSGTAPGRGRLNGRRILVVGGGQRVFDAATDPIGNGRAMSLLFAREGAHVAVADLNRTSAEDTVARIADDGGRAFAIAADVTQEADVIRMIDEAHRTMGGLDGMVLNIGTFGKTGLDNVSAEEWNRIYDVNVRGPMLCCRAALPKFEDGGSIVFISSIAALKAGSQMAVYDSSKAALGGLMRNIAHTGARRGIRANLVYPGLVDTPNGREAGAGRPSRGKGHIPFGRQATAWEIAYAVLFFMSDESVYVTAQTLAVDSGLSGM